METGAQCARHEGVAAVGVCARCGNFMCAECNGTRALCTSCDEKTRFVPLAASASLAEHINAAWLAFKSQAGVIIGALGIWLMFWFVGRYIGNNAAAVLRHRLGVVPTDAALNIDVGQLFISLAISSAFNWFVAALFDTFTIVGVFQVLLEVLQGRKANLAMMFDLSRARRAAPVTLALFAIKLPLDGSLFVLLAVSLQGQHFNASDTQAMLQAFSHGGTGLLVGSLITQLVGFVVLPLRVFAIPQFVTHGTSAGETLRAAWRMAAGHRLRIVGWSLVSLVALFVGAIACCIGLVFVGPLILLVWCSLFLSLRAAANQ